MVKKLDIHPFLAEIDLCDYLLRYCEKTLGKDQENKPVEKVVNEQERKEQEEKRKKAIEEALEKGKLERVER